MAITDYASLQSTVADWLLRSDLTAVIPTFIQLAEARMNRDERLRTLESEESGTLATTGGSDAVTLPADFHSVITMDLVGIAGIFNNEPLEYITPREFKRKQRDNCFATGVPLYYTIIGGQFRLVPTPDTDYELALDYNVKLAALSVSNTTNWLLENSPDLYLYATLCESAPYLDQDERIATWIGGYNERAEAFRIEADAKRYNGSPLKMRARPIGG